MARSTKDETRYTVRRENGESPFKLKPDIQEWIDWKLTDESWEEWRKENQEWVNEHINTT